MEKIRKRDGFPHQYLFVLPEEWLREVSGNELFRALIVTDIGYFPAARHHYRERPRGCDTAVLLFCNEGEGFVGIGAQPERAVGAGQAVLIPPGTPHRYGAAGDNPWSVYWAHLRGGLLAPFLELLGGEAPVTVPQRIGGDILREFYRCFGLLKLPYHTEEYFLLCQSAGSILALLAAAGKQSRQRVTCEGEQAVEECIRYMRANLSRPLTAGQIAEASGFSVSHLSAVFKQSTGFSPVAYFLRMKMHAASKELYFTGRSVKETALEFGIGDPYYFSRIFKKVMGESPAKYRGRVKG
jgi:AraC-like DNA-binding protein/mannose-6-phosphate isomerase-like protein (cupin superfamily)